MWNLNSPWAIFVRMDYYFQLNLDMACFMLYGGMTKIVGDMESKNYDNNVSD